MRIPIKNSQLFRLETATRSDDLSATNSDWLRQLRMRSFGRSELTKSTHS